MYTNINGKLYFDSEKCVTLAAVHGRDTALRGAAAYLAQVFR